MPFPLPHLPQRRLAILLGILCFSAILFCLLWPPLFFPDSTKFAASLPPNLSETKEPPALSPSLRSAFGERIWRELSGLNCSKLVASDHGYVQKASKHRIVQSDPPKLAMECASIKARWKFPDGAGTREEADFPMAFARTVFRDYLLLEQMLSVEFAPQNFYCYAIDRKANKKFKERVRTLAKCFRNVLVVKEELDVKSNGKNVSRSHLACLRELDREGRNWKYAFLLQNHDYPLRTNAEFVRIFQAYNGTNSIATRKIVKISVNLSLDWSIRSLGLYRNKNQIPPGLDRLRHTKSLNLIALSRAAVQFTLNKLNLGPFIDQLERSRYGMDEVLFSTLNSNLPDFPGGFTSDCLFRHNRSVQSMGRYTIWRNYGTQTDRCLSNHFRHDLCIYGVEDLGHISRASLNFYFNKMLPSFDYGAIFCWLKTLAARRQATKKPEVNTKFYGQLPHVRYNRLKGEGHLNKFEC